MTTQQNDAALTDEQLEGVAGGSAYIKGDGVRGGLGRDPSGLVQRRNFIRRITRPHPNGHAKVINPDSM